MTYLPKVDAQVAYPLAQEVKKYDDIEYIDKEMAFLDEVNPAISTWIREYSKITNDPEGAMICSIVVYKLLDSQAQVNFMETF